LVFNRILTALLLAVAPLSGFAEFRDPTTPIVPLSPKTESTEEVKTATPETPLVLSAIWISAKSRRATINGVTAKSGQTILGDIKVVRIARNTVTIQQNGETKTLQLLHRPYSTR